MEMSYKKAALAVGFIFLELLLSGSWAVGVDRAHFPPSFLFGTSTSSYQVSATPTP